MQTTYNQNRRWGFLNWVLRPLPPKVMNEKSLKMALKTLILGIFVRLGDLV